MNELSTLDEKHCFGEIDNTTEGELSVGKMP